MKHSTLSLTSILIVLAILLSGASGGNEKHQNQTNSYHHEVRHKPNAAATPFTIIVQPAPVTVIQPNPALEENKPIQKWYERPTVTDWGVLIVTVLYVGASIGLLIATQRQAGISERALKALDDTLIETRKSADAATKGTDFAVHSFFAAHRPWVLVDHFEIARLGNGHFQVNFFAYNVGELPALFRGGVEITLVALKLPDSVQFEKALDEAFVIPPNGSSQGVGVTLNSPLKVSPEDWASIRAGDKTLYFVGYLTYEGPFRSQDGTINTFKTGFSAKHTGPLTYDQPQILRPQPSPNEPLTSWTMPPPTNPTSPIPTRMSVMTDPRYNYLI